MSLLPGDGRSKLGARAASYPGRTRPWMDSAGVDAGEDVHDLQWMDFATATSSGPTDIRPRMEIAGPSVDDRSSGVHGWKLPTLAAVED